jgi:hypothetical protein
LWFQATLGKKLATPSQPIAVCDGIHLHPKLHGRLRFGGWWFQDSLGKKKRKEKLARPSSQQKKAGCGGTHM